MISNNIFPTLSAMLEGYTSERLRNLIETLHDSELSQTYSERSWIDPRRVPLEILNSLYRRNMHRHIRIIIYFVMNNSPNPRRMDIEQYNEKINSLKHLLETQGFIYENGILKTRFPNPPETNQNLEDIRYLLNQHNFTDILNHFTNYLESYSTNPYTSLGNLRVLFEKLVEKAGSNIPNFNNCSFKDKLRELQNLNKLPTVRNQYLLNHFYGIYACLSRWGSHGSISDDNLLNYITSTSISAILLLLKNI